MARAATGPSQSTAGTPDVLSNLADFGRHLRAGNRSPATIKSYAEAVRQLDAFLEAKGMPRSVAAIRREHVESFLEDQLARLRPASAAARYRSLQQFFRWLVGEGEIAESPMARMRPPAIPEAPPAVLRREHIEALLKATAGTDFESRRDRAIVSLLLDSGMRRAELAGIRLEDLDMEREDVIVMGKGRRPRVCPFEAETARDLSRYLKARAKRPDARSPWLWLGKKGRLTEDGIAQVLKRRGQEAGLEGRLHPHLFRHTFAHQMLSSGMQEGDLMRLAGWRSRQMLARYGASAADERARDAFRRIKAAQR
ncbi:MAG: tyrosine-type recombinase/integrase [Chloroflexota bacterium]|nr:tyrosine-type recombinase/integrase [Chloroflexota bacterium]